MRAWAARDTGCRLEVVRDAGHVSSLDQPEQVNNLMASFITKATSGEAIGSSQITTSLA
jgi:pimeloyl-ACP methyl ester carboxylesterase